MTTKEIVVFESESGATISIAGKMHRTSKRGDALMQVISYYYKKYHGVRPSPSKLKNLVEFKNGPSSTKKMSMTVKKNDVDINTRFDFFSKLMQMVASGVQQSLVVVGEGGLGKTFTVRKVLESAGLVDVSHLGEFSDGTKLIRKKSFVFVKGYSTAKGLYRTLYENNDSTIVFDDCDSVLKDPVALNLLKGALDSYDKRIISWNADMRDEDLPRSFNFTGRVVFISNLSIDKIDQAIRSRSMVIDLSMDTEQKVARMEMLANSKDFLPDFDVKVKKDAMALIKSIQNEINEISLRSLITVCKIRAANSDWKELATYMLTN